MATVYKTPGVYVEEISTFPPSVAQVETAVPAFIGYTQKAEKNGEDLTLKPLRISSMLEYRKYFGDAQLEESIEVSIHETVKGGNVIDSSVTADFADPKKKSKHIMNYALELFYDNQGGPCYIVSVGAYKANIGDPLDDAELKKGLDALEKADEPTLIVFPEAIHLATAKACYDLMNASLAQCSKLQDRFAVIDVYPDANNDRQKAIDELRNRISSDIDLAKYGAVYYPNLMTNVSFEYDENEVTIEHKVTQIADDGSETDTDGAAHGKKLAELQATLNSFYAAAKGAINNMDYEMPPSAAMVGLYAYVDRTRGVWKAPANISLQTVNDLTDQLTNEDQENLNVDAVSGKSVNVIRFFTGKGILVWGARTLAGNDNEWRYVSVRRFFNMVEESCKKATAQFVFEPNDANTWTKVRAMIENFLTVLWRQGALAGAKPEQAFFVKCGLGQTMTALDILEGRMIVEIGMAAVRPAEFIILRFSHKMQES
jgi:hypothetical protein